jgi:murein DD-endopeptidase MepM/ murein hydrolase activator NlpD
MVLEYPVTNPLISQKFGEDNTNHPLRKKFYSVFGNKHPGVDFKMEVGEEIYAAYPGIVVRKEFHKGMGNVIGIRNGNVVILYAHLSRFIVELSQIVRSGELIGLSGETGAACTEPHLHFEMRDITHQKLKDMVFEPIFSHPIKQWKNTVEYKVNNTNTPKTLCFLSERYFGKRDYWTRIANYNPTILRKPGKIIDQGTKVIIPNYI